MSKRVWEGDFPFEQRSPYQIPAGIGGLGKIERPQATSHLQGCGNPNCDICMPKGNPAGAGGALGGGGSGSASEALQPQMMEFIARSLSQPFVSAEMLANEMLRTYTIDTATQASIAQSNTTAARRDAARERAVAEERRLRPKVERFFLDTTHAIGWDDVVGNDVARTALLEAIEHPVLHKDLYAFYGRKPTKGVLLYGPPGCGKTMFGKAAAAVLARLHDRPAGQHSLLSIAGPEIQSPYVGVTEALIRDVFAYARASKALYGYPMVVFIDEADAILPCRDGSGTGRRALPWEESNVATFLTEMDGLEDSGAFVILATNRPAAIDPALLRDGRCDRRIKIERPDRDAVTAVLAKSIAGMPLSGVAPEALLERVVEDVLSPEHRLATLRYARGPSFVTLGDTVSGAMLVGLTERAKAIAFRRDLTAGGTPSGVTAPDFADAVQDLLRESRGIMPVEAINEMAERLGVKLTAVELTSDHRRGHAALRGDDGVR